MKILYFWLRKLTQDLLTRLKTCRKFSKKRCFIFLSFYAVCIILAVSCLKEHLNLNKYENCTIQNVTVLEIEKNLSQNVDDYLKIFLKDTAIENALAKQKWTHIANNIYVYSAFLEVCPPELLLNSKFCVKFIGIVLSNSSSVSPFLSSLKCVVKRNSNISQGEYATIELLPENHFQLFTVAFFFCTVKSVIITHASVYDSKCVNVTWFAIKNNIVPTTSNQYTFRQVSNIFNPPQGISLCVRPLYNNFVALPFSEFLSYYLVMGVDHFIFYYLESFKPLEIFLKFLKFTNISTEVHLWDMPLDNDLIHEYGQIAFTQDCIARSKYKFSHTIIADLDEYIVPQVHDNFKILVSYLDNKHYYAGSYVIPMALFCHEYSVQKFDISPFHILNHNKRQKTHWYHQYRSKYILRPERVRYSGIHFTWKHEKNYQEVFVSPSIALLNHYRPCCGMAQTYFFHLLEFKVLSDKVVDDDALVKHENELMNNNLLKFIFDIIFDKA